MNVKKVLVVGGAAVAAYWLWKKSCRNAASGFAGLDEDFAASRLKTKNLWADYENLWQTYYKSAAGSNAGQALDTAGFDSHQGIYMQLMDEMLAAEKLASQSSPENPDTQIEAMSFYDALAPKIVAETKSLQSWIAKFAVRLKADTALKTPNQPSVVVGPSSLPPVVVGKLDTKSNSKTLVTVAVVAAGLGLAYMLLRKKSAAPAAAPTPSQPTSSAPASTGLVSV